MHAAEALALEQAAVASVQPLRVALQALTRSLSALWVRQFGSLDAPADPVAVHLVIAELRNGLAQVDVPVADRIARYTERAVAMGVRQAKTEVLETARFKPTPAGTTPPFEATVHAITPDVPLDPTIQAAVDGVDAVVRDKLDTAAREAEKLPDEASWDDVTHVMAHANRAATSAESTAGWSVNAAINHGAEVVADQLGVEKLWQAERNACTHCLGLSGHVSKDGVFDASLTFGKKPLPVWPEGDLKGPPRHPHCRCRVTPWLGSVPGYTGPDLPAALKREAERSILTGWRLDSESETARVAAAKALLERGTNLPKSVQARARRAVVAGAFGPFPRERAS